LRVEVSNSGAPALAEAERKGEMPYRDGIHVNAVGQRVLAEVLEQVVVAR